MRTGTRICTPSVPELGSGSIPIGGRRKRSASQPKPSAPTRHHNTGRTKARSAHRHWHVNETEEARVELSLAWGEHACPQKSNIKTAKLPNRELPRAFYLCGPAILASGANGEYGRVGVKK
jgi:hypothetical protein